MLASSPFAPRVCMYVVMGVGVVPLAERGVSAPEHNGQADHEERMGAKVGGDREVAVERG